MLNPFIIAGLILSAVGLLQEASDDDKGKPKIGPTGMAGKEGKEGKAGAVGKTGAAGKDGKIAKASDG